MQGAATYDASTRTYTVSGSGENMWAARTPSSSSGRRSPATSRSRPMSLLGEGGDPHRKACLMIRQSLDADSAYVDVALHGDGLTSLQFREPKGEPRTRCRRTSPARRGCGIEKRGQVRVRCTSRPRGRGAAFSGAAVRIALRSRSTSASASVRTTRT